jgi:putative Mg2+ transporter-C (MgtC) family protein
VVTGLGFLGAGTIIHAGGSIHGLTTAASLWTVGAIGLAIGCGYYNAALLTTLIMLVTLHTLDGIEKYLVRRAGPKAEAALKRMLFRGE